MLFHYRTNLPENHTTQVPLSYPYDYQLKLFGTTATTVRI